jgi:hypothetical protein
VIHVAAGGDLQAAIDAARPGDTIALERGATFVGNFVLPMKSGSGYVTIRTDGDDGLPGEGARVVPADAPLLAKIKSSDVTAALRTAPGAHHWRLLLLEFQANEKGRGDIILLGSGDRDQNSLDVVPHDLIVDRCYVHGDPAIGQKRGIALNSATTEIVNSYISDIKAVGQDSQALGGWNGPGPYRIENNYLEAAGENFLMGGAAPYIHGLTPSDISFRFNHLAKPLDWRQSRWQVKNLFELKNARRVVIEGNVFVDVEEPFTNSYAGPKGRIVARGNVFVGESGTGEGAGGSVEEPRAHYSYTLDDPNAVQAIVTAGAGVGHTGD